MRDRLVVFGGLATDVASILLAFVADLVWFAADLVFVVWCSWHHRRRRDDA